MKINQISPQDNVFLQRLTHIANAPDKLYYIGNLPSAPQPTLAVVGTRKPSRYGIEVTSRLVSEIAKHGVLIVSGLALGIDAVAHRTTLEAGGRTIAIVPSELPKIQPATNRNLAQQILDRGGAILSEHTVGDNYVLGKWSFLERNRLVAGISDAVLITEAAARSGTLNTAMHALEQGKEVFVVPGNITSPLSVGCNNLIRQGATPVTSAEQILEIIKPDYQKSKNIVPKANNPLEAEILKLITSGTNDSTDIQIKLKIDPIELNMALTMLELDGTIKALGMNKWAIR